MRQSVLGGLTCSLFTVAATRDTVEDAAHRLMDTESVTFQRRSFLQASMVQEVISRIQDLDGRGGREDHRAEGDDARPAPQVWQDHVHQGRTGAAESDGRAAARGEHGAARAGGFGGGAVVCGAVRVTRARARG